MIDEEIGMPAKRELSMRQLRHLLRLHHDGVSAREIGRRLGVARSTIQDNLKRAAAAGLKWPLDDDVTEEALELQLFGRAAIATGRRRRVEPDWAALARELKRPGVTMMILWEEYREVQPEGYGYSRFCDLLRGFERRLTPVMRQHHVAREKAFVDYSGKRIGLAQRGHDEARIGLALCPFRLADHPAPARPTVERGIAEVLVAAGGLAGRGGLRFGLKEFDRDLLDEPRIARQAEHEVHPVVFAPGHQRFAGEPGIGAQKNARPGPARPDLRDDPRDLLDRAGAAIDVRPPQLGRQQMPAAEHIQRQVAVTVVVAVEEPALLVAVQRVVGGVEVENDLSGRLCVRLEEEVDEQGLDRRGFMRDLAVLRRRVAREFQPVQRRFARCRRAVAAAGVRCTAVSRWSFAGLKRTSSQTVDCSARARWTALLDRSAWLSGD